MCRTAVILCGQDPTLIWKSAFVLPLFKGGDHTQLNNDQPISKLSVLAKVLETFVNNQSKDFFSVNNILSDFQSGFRKQHSTTTADLKVLNDFIESVDNKKHCAALFIDLSKAFDTGDHTLLIQCLVSIGLSEHAIGWFNNYLSNRTRRIQADGFISSSLNVTKGVPQGSVLFTIY